MDVLQRLKSETRADHIRLEQLLPFGHSDLTLKNYIQALQSFSGVVPFLESRLLGLSVPSEFDLASRLRTQLLYDDMRVLNIVPLPALKSWDNLTLMQGLGALYVLEGSRLGGALIAREISALNLTPEYGASYFAPGAELSRQWKSFCSALEAYIITETQAQEVVLGASQTFQAFLSAWLSVSAPDKP